MRWSVNYGNAPQATQTQPVSTHHARHPPADSGQEVCDGPARYALGRHCDQVPHAQAEALDEPHRVAKEVQRTDQLEDFAQCRAGGRRGESEGVVIRARREQGKGGIQWTLSAVNKA